jgi:hypothetical protein
MNTQDHDADQEDKLRNADDARGAQRAWIIARAWWIRYFHVF